MWLSPFTVLLVGCANWSREKPIELTLMEETRQGILTAEIDWQLLRPQSELPLQRYTSRIGGSETWTTSLGDENGARSLRVESGMTRPNPEPPGHALRYQDRCGR